MGDVVQDAVPLVLGDLRHEAEIEDHKPPLGGPQEVPEVATGGEGGVRGTGGGGVAVG